MTVARGIIWLPIVVLMLVACGGEPLAVPQTEPTVSPPEPASVRARVGNAPEEGTEHRKTLERDAEEFEASHPNVDIIFDTWEPNPEAFATYLASGQATDVIVVPATEGQLIIDNNYAADLTEFFNTWDVDTDFNPAILAPYDSDGRIYALPTSIYILGLFYDKPLFQQAGLVDEKGESVPPTTWQEFVEAAKIIKSKDDLTCRPSRPRQPVGWHLPFR